MSVPHDHAERPARVLAILATIGIAIVIVVLVRSPSANDRPEWVKIAPPLEVPMHPWQWIVIHHSGTPGGDTGSIDNAHLKDRGWEGIGYHFVIGNGRPMERGRIEATWRWRCQYHGAHAGSMPAQAAYNQDGIGICVIGDYQTSQLDAFVEERVARLCALLIQHVPTLSEQHIVGHRDIRQTACPGANVDINRIRYLVRSQLALTAAK
ncbi:MAG: N-acetylmuramoyl-L-alanine amidase [Planctomycetes bacterium]|nr:N-acetylmuramoyl-L-alanine amidase [Planctomycetota bacterium]